MGKAAFFTPAATPLGKVDFSTSWRWVRGHGTLWFLCETSGGCYKLGLLGAHRCFVQLVIFCVGGYESDYCYQNVYVKSFLSHIFASYTTCLTIKTFSARLMIILSFPTLCSNIITQRSAVHYFDRVLHATCDVRTSSLLLSKIVGEIWVLMHETKLKIVRGSPSETQSPGNASGSDPSWPQENISRSCIMLFTLFSPERYLMRVYWWINGWLWVFAWRNCSNTRIQQLPRRLFGSFCIIQFIRGNQSIISSVEDVNSL